MAIRVEHTWNEFKPFMIERVEYTRYQKMVEDNINLVSQFKEGLESLMRAGFLTLALFLMFIFGFYTQWGLFSLIIAVIGCLGSVGMAMRFGFLLMYDFPSEMKRKRFWRDVEIDIKYSESHFKTLSRADKYTFALKSPYDIFLARQKQRYPSLA